MARKSDFVLPTLDDLFSSQEERNEAKLTRISDIPIELIDSFPDHPFHVRDDEDMMQLVESIKERGVMGTCIHSRETQLGLAFFRYASFFWLDSREAACTKTPSLAKTSRAHLTFRDYEYRFTPATVRPKDDGRYELVSGHRRKRACELAGMDMLRCEVVELNRDQAIILMVESNFQRTQILPSEKAFAYKMRLEAMKRQAGRPSKNNSDPVGPNLLGTRSNAELSSETGDSTSQIKRYIRLTNLVPELLEFVDEGRIKMRPAVELSYLDEDCQRDLVDEIDRTDATPSHDQTIRMRKFFDEGKLTAEVIQAIMEEEKPNQKEKIVLRGERVRQLIPKSVPLNKTEEYVCKALEYYASYQRRRSERDAR
jgi:ParB family chromosome partitioning protein